MDNTAIEAIQLARHYNSKHYYSCWPCSSNCSTHAVYETANEPKKVEIRQLKSIYEYVSRPKVAMSPRGCLSRKNKA
jgi:hypothetical protein